MTVSITTAHNTARLGGTLQFLDSGPANARCRLYEGTRPASASATPTSVMLAEINLTKPAGIVDNGQLTLTQLENGMIQNTGIATWARFVCGDESTAFDCDVGQGVPVIPQQWEVQLAQTQLFAGGDVKIISAVLG